jgi:hypothetical protein
MPRHTRRLQKQAASLFLLAEDAFGRGSTQLGEELTALALHYLDEAHGPEAGFVVDSSSARRRAGEGDAAPETPGENFIRGFWQPRLCAR